jgi:DNA repair protein RecN (Recombination protein N)
VAEVARMLGGERNSGTSLAHAQELIAQAVAVAQSPDAPPSNVSPITQAPRGRTGAR